MKYRTALLNLPLYSVRIRFAVTDDIQRFRNRYDRLFGPYDCGSATGLASNCGRNFMLILHERYVTHGHIAHEIFHVTHRIMEWVDNDITRESHEPHAYLCEHLTNHVYDLLAKWRYKVRRLQ